MPIRPTGSPWMFSSWVSNRSSACTWETSVTLGRMTTSSLASGAAPTAETTSMMSAWVHGVVQSLTRTPRNCPAHPGAASAAATRVRASAFASGATASSKSRKTSSAGRALALSIIFWLLPGTDKQVRRGRYALAIVHSPPLKYPMHHGLDQQGVRRAAGANDSAGPDGRIPRPSARRRGQHQHCPPAAPRPWTRGRNALAPKDIRADSAGRRDRAGRPDAEHRQRLTEPVRPTTRRSTGDGANHRHQGSGQRPGTASARRHRGRHHRPGSGADSNPGLDGHPSRGAHSQSSPGAAIPTSWAGAACRG